MRGLNYKEIVWIALQTDTANSVKHSIRFGLIDTPSTPNHCLQRNLHFRGFQRHIKLGNRLRIEGEQIFMSDYKDIVWIALQTDTDSVKHVITFGLFNFRSTQTQCIH